MFGTNHVFCVTLLYTKKPVGGKKTDNSINKQLALPVFIFASSRVANAKSDAAVSARDKLYNRAKIERPTITMISCGARLIFLPLLFLLLLSTLCGCKAINTTLCTIESFHVTHHQKTISHLQILQKEKYRFLFNTFLH